MELEDEEDEDGEEEEDEEEGEDEEEDDPSPNSSVWRLRGLFLVGKERENFLSPLKKTCFKL